MGLVVGPAGAPTLYYVHADHLDRVQKITDGTQAIVWDGQFTPYGRTHAITGTVTNPLRFPGQWADPAAGYFYNYMRDYDPTLARYLSVDPLGTEGGRNKFSYAGANPQNLVDPQGLEVIYERDGVRFRAYPGPPAGGREHARQGPCGAYHVHLEDLAGRKGPRVNVQSLPIGPLTAADASSFTGKFRDVCRALTAQEQGYLNRAAREIFHTGTLPQNVRDRGAKLQEQMRLRGRGFGLPRPGGPP